MKRRLLLRMQLRLAVLPFLVAVQAAVNTPALCERLGAIVLDWRAWRYAVGVVLRTIMPVALAVSISMWGVAATLPDAVPSAHALRAHHRLDSVLAQ